MVKALSKLKQHRRFFMRRKSNRPPSAFISWTALFIPITGGLTRRPPAHIIEGGIPTEALLAQIAVSKYADGLPLLSISTEHS